jgi:hypothetical protein
MYRLDLSDPRLALPVPVYGSPEHLATLSGLKEKPDPRKVAFFALDRPAQGTVAIPGSGQAAFHILPADLKDPPATTVPLFEFVHANGKQRAYSTDADWSKAGFKRSEKPVGRVWP